MKTRLTKLEKQQRSQKGPPNFWREENDPGGQHYIAIQPHPYLLALLEKLGRTPKASPYIGNFLRLNLSEPDIIERKEGRQLYLKGLDQPLLHSPNIIFIDPEQ